MPSYDGSTRLQISLAQGFGVHLKNPFRLPPEKAHFRPELERALVEELYQWLHVAIWGLLITLAVMYYGLAVTIQHHAIVGRMLQGMFVVVLLRAISAGVVWRSPDMRLRLWIYIVGSTLTALCLAFFNVVSYPLLPPTDVALVALMDAGICSVALISMGSSFVTYLLFMVPILGSLSLIVAFGAQARWTHSLLILSMIYLGALFVLSLQQAMFHRRELILRMELAELSLRDNLTRLRNRRALMEFMSVEIEQIQRSWRGIGDPARRKPPTSLGMLMIDMDHFKSVNDTYGHAAGDAVLVQLATVLSEACRKADLVVRWGGEEFVIVARDTDRSSPSILAERIRGRVEQHLFRLPSGEIIRRSCSIGYSVFPFSSDFPDLLTWDRVIAIADAGMYYAKTHGRNRGVGIMSGERIEKHSIVPDLLKEGLDQSIGNGLVRLLE
jgi:diguanylate cyclase (GGDEF)-like protein